MAFPHDFSYIPMASALIYASSLPHTLKTAEQAFYFEQSILEIYFSNDYSVLFYQTTCFDLLHRY